MFYIKLLAYFLSYCKLASSKVCEKIDYFLGKFKVVFLLFLHE